MVRETRYLLVRNIPEKSTEESVNHHFQRYGKIQSVKLQPSKDNDSTLTATVAFMDIRSASKAHSSKNTIDNAVLRTDYWDATSSRTAGDSGRNSGSNAGGGGTSGGSGVGGSSGYHGSGLPASTVTRAGSGNGGSYSGSWTGGGNFRHGSDRNAEGSRAQGEASEKEPRFDRSRSSPDLSSKKSVSVSRSASRSRSRSPRSRSGSSSSRTYSSESSKSCSKSQRWSQRESRIDRKHREKKRPSRKSHGSSQGSARPQSMIGALKSTIASEIKDPKADRHKDNDAEDKRPLGICITGLPARSSDSSLRDGLFHNYKKHGKVTSVQIASENGERYAIVSFRKPEDAAKALEASKNKMFFGTQIKVTSHEGIKTDDVDIRSGDMDMDEFHPKATRTLFIGNLEKDTSVQDLLDKFGSFGDIIDVDIKRQGAASAYAFVQYTDITSVVRALQEMEGEHIGANKIKLGFGKSMPTNCVWIDNIGENWSEKSLTKVFKKYGDPTYTFIDRKKWRALIFFSNLDDAQYAVTDMKTRVVNKRKVMVDFASRECQSNFLDKMEKSGQLRPENRPDERGLHRFRQRSFDYQEGYSEENRSRFSSPWNRSGRGRSRYNDGSYDDYSPARRNSRQSSDFSQSGSFYKNVDDYELELREYGHSQRERRERGHSPRRDDYDDRSRRSSREVSLDRYDGKDRLDYARSTSPGSEHNSFRSERFVTRTVEDKPFRDKFDKDKSEDKVLDRLGGDTSLDVRGRRSPVYVSGGCGSGVDDDMGSMTPPTPTQEEPIYRTFYPRSKDDDNFTPTFAVIEPSKPKLKSVWVSQTAPVSSSPSPSISSKLGSEVTLPEKSSVRKRVHEDSVLNKDSNSKKKSDKLESVGSLTLKLTPAERQRQERKQSRSLGSNKQLNKPTKSESKLRLKTLEGTLSSPGSSGSHPESENGSVSEADMLNLQRKKQLLLDKLDKLSQQEDRAPAGEGNMEEDTLRDSKLTGSEWDEVASVEELMKIDSKQGCRKQMEQITKMEMRLKEKKREKLLALQAAEGRSGTGDVDFKITVPVDSSRVNSTGNSPSDSKRRKLDMPDETASDLSKHSYNKASDLKPPSKDSRSALDVSGCGLGAGSVSHNASGVFSSRLKDSAGSHQDRVLLSGYSGSSKLSSGLARPDKQAKGVSKHFSSGHSQEKYSYSPKFGPSPEACFSPTVSEEPAESNHSESLTEKSSPKPLSPVADWSQQGGMSPTSKDSDDDLAHGGSKHDPGLLPLAHVDDSLSDTSDEEKVKIDESSLEERIRKVDEIMQLTTMNKMQDIATINASSAGGSSGLSSPGSMPSSLYSKYRIRKRCEAQMGGGDGLGLEKKSEPSMIMQQLLSKPSILDQDFQRLGQLGEKYEAAVTVGVAVAGRPGVSSHNKLPLKDVHQAVGLHGQHFPSTLDNCVTGMPALVHPPVTTALASMHPPTTTTTTMTMAGQQATTVTTSVLQPTHRSSVSSLAVPSSSPASAGMSPRQHPPLTSHLAASHPTSTVPTSRPVCATVSASSVVVSSLSHPSAADTSSVQVAGTEVNSDKSYTMDEQDSLRGASVHESKNTVLNPSSSSVVVTSNHVGHGETSSQADDGTVVGQTLPKHPNGSRSPRVMDSLTVSVHSPAAATTPSVSPVPKKDAINPQGDGTLSRSSPGIVKVDSVLSSAVAGRNVIAEDPVKPNPTSAPSAKVANKDNCRSRDGVSQVTEDRESNKTTVTPRPPAPVSQPPATQTSVIHSTPVSTSAPASTSTVTSSVVTTTISSSSSSTSSGRPRGDNDRQNKPARTSRSVDQAVKHDPLFAPDIKPEPANPKPVEPKPNPSKEKEKKDTEAAEKRSQSEPVVKTEPETKEKKSHGRGGSSSSHSDRKVSKSSSREGNLDKSEKKEQEVKHEPASTQKSSDKSRQDSSSSSRTKNKDTDSHSKSKEVDGHAKTRDTGNPSGRSKDSDSAGKNKEMGDVHSRSKDGESSTKSKDTESHSKNKDKKSEVHIKSGDKDSDTQGKGNSKESESNPKPSGSDSHVKIKDKEHHSHGKNSDKDSDSHSKGKDKDSDSVKSKENATHGKSKDSESHSKNKTKHKEDSKKDSRDHSTESDARSKSRDHSTETDPRNKSKEKHHDGHKKDKEKKFTPEKKTPEKMETPKEEKKSHIKTEEKKEEKKPVDSQDKDKGKQKDKHDTKPDASKSESKSEKSKSEHHQEGKKDKSNSKNSDKSAASNSKEQKSHGKDDHKQSDSSKGSSSKPPKDGKDSNPKSNKNKESETPAKSASKKNPDEDKKKDKDKEKKGESDKRQQQKKEKEKEKEKEKNKEKEKKEKEKEKEREKEKEKEKEKSGKKKDSESKRKKPADDDDDFPYHLLDDTPVFTSMYDTIKRRSCKREAQVAPVTQDTREKLGKLKSRRGSTKKTKSPAAFLDDSSSDESDSNLLSLSDSQDSDSDVSPAKSKPKKKTQQPQASAKKKRPLVLSSSSDDEEEEVETAFLQMSKSKPKASKEKFGQIFTSSSSEDDLDLDEDSSPERPPPKPKAAAKTQEKKSKPKKQVKKRKKVEDSDGSDIPDLEPEGKLSKSSGHLTSLSDISMDDDSLDEIEKAPQKKMKKKKDEKPQKAKKTEDVPAKKAKLLDSRDSLVENKEKKAEKKEKPAEKKTKKEEKKEEKNNEKKMPCIEKMDTSSETEKGPEPEAVKPSEPAKEDSKKKKKKKENKSKFNLDDLALDTSTPSTVDSLPQSSKPEPKSKKQEEEEQEEPAVKKKKKKKEGKEQAEQPQPEAEPKQEPKPEPKPVVSSPPPEEKLKAKETKKEESPVKTPKPEKEKKKKKNVESKPDDTSSLPEPTKTPEVTGNKTPAQKKAGKQEATPDLQSPENVSTLTDDKKKAKQEKAKEKKEKKTKSKTPQAISDNEKSAAETGSSAKDSHREPILQMLAEDMQREEKSKDKAEKGKAKQKDKEAEDSSTADESGKTKPKKKKKKREEKESPNLGSPSFSISSLVAETEAVKQSEPASQPESNPEPEEPEDPFVSFWGHPAPVIHKKRDSIPKADDGKDDKKQSKSEDSPSSEAEGGKPTADEKKPGTTAESKPVEIKKPLWDMSIFAFDQEPSAPAHSTPASSEQEPKPLIDIPVDAFKPDTDETTEKSDMDSDKKGQKKKAKKKKEKSDRKGSKEIDPLAAVEAAIKDDPVLTLQDVIDKKGVLPERRFSLEDESSPLFKSPPGKADQKQADSKMSDALLKDMPDPSYSESENDIGVFTPFTKETGREKVVSAAGTEKAESVLQEAGQEKAREEGEDNLALLERDELAMQEASDEAARAVECLLGFQEDNNQYSFDNNDNLQVPSNLPGSAGMDTVTTLSSPPAVESMAVQSQPDTAGPEIHEASEAPQASSQADVQQQSLSVMQQQQQEPEAKTEPADTKKGQRRGKRQNRSKGSRDTPLKGDGPQQPDVTGLFPGQSPPYPVPGETHFPSMPDVSKLEGPEQKRNPIDAYDFEAQMNEEDPSSDLIVESALGGMHSSSSDETMKSPRRRNTPARGGGRGKRGRGGTIRETLEKVGKGEQPPPSPVVDQPLPSPQVPMASPALVSSAPQAPVIPAWQQDIVKGDLASPDSKTDLDSSYGEAELVINLDDQNTPTDGEDRAKYQFGSDTEDKSPAHQAAASSPYKAARSTRTRKLPNYKAMDQGLSINSPSPRTSRSGSSPRGARGGQSPKNPPTPRGKASSDFSSPIVKLDRIEVGRGKKKDESGQKLRPGGKDSEGIEDIMHTSFEDWKAANMAVDQKPVSKENIYDFADSEQDQKLEPSPVFRGPRGRTKRPSDGADTKTLDMPTVTAATALPVQPHGPLIMKEQLQEEQAQASDDSSSSMSNVDKIIDAVSKGLFDYPDDKKPQEEVPSRPAPRGRGGARNMQGPKHVGMEMENKPEGPPFAVMPPVGRPPGDFAVPVSIHEQHQQQLHHQQQHQQQQLPQPHMAPIHPRAGKAKQEIQAGLAFSGELPPGISRDMSTGFTPSATPPDMAAVSRAGSMMKPESVVSSIANTVPWPPHSVPASLPASVPTTSAVTSLPGRSPMQQPEVLRSVPSSLTGPPSQMLPPPPHSVADLAGRMKKEGVFPPASSQHQHQLQPPASSAAMSHQQMTMRGGAPPNREGASPLQQIASMPMPQPGMPPVSHSDPGRRTGVFCVREPPQVPGMVSSVPVSTRAALPEPRYTSTRMSPAPVNVITTSQQGLLASSGGSISTGHSRQPPHPSVTSVPTSMPPVPALIQTSHSQPGPKAPHNMPPHSMPPKGWPGSGPLGPGAMPGQQPPGHTPPSPSQMSPTTSMQPQRPSSAHLPAASHLDTNPAPLALKRPPSAHSSQPAQAGGGRDSRPGRPPSHHGDLRPPSLPGDLMTGDMAAKGAAAAQERRERELDREREREREREQQILHEHLARLHPSAAHVHGNYAAMVAAAQRQGLPPPPPPAFMMAHGEHGPLPIPRSMPPPSQHEPPKSSLPSSSAGTPTTATVTSPAPSHQHLGRRGSVHEPVSSKVPPATSAGTLYTGVVAGQPRSLSPKTASPVGQVIERLPNPMRPEPAGTGRGPSMAHRPPAPAMHQDPSLHPRYHKDEGPLRPMQPPAAHGEGRSHEILMMQMLEQQQRIMMMEAARQGAAARSAQDMVRTTAAQEAAARSAASQEASRVAAAQESARSSAAAAAAAAKEAARKEVWSAHEVERAMQEASISRGGPQSAHKPEPGGRAQLPGMPPIPSSAASVQQVPLNLADSDSRSGGSDSRDRAGSGSKPPPSPFSQPPGPASYMERERDRKQGERGPPESPHVPGGTFVPPGGGPAGAHREGLPPPLYGSELFHAPPFGMGRMPLDPRLYPGQQHPPPHPPFLPGREGVLAGPFQRFPPDQHPDAERLLKKGEMPPGGILHMRSPSPIPSPSPRMPPEMVSHPMMRVEIPVREHLSAVLGRYQMVWQGMLALKNDHSYVQMHFVSGSRELPDQALPQPVIGGAALPLRISQRMRLEPPNLEGVTKRMINEKDYSLLLAVPCGHDHMDISEQTRNLTVGFIEYLRSKLAAGIVNVSHPGTQQPAFVVHVFPPCDFSMEVVARHSSGLVEQIHDLAHVIIIITTV